MPPLAEPTPPEGTGWKRLGAFNDGVLSGSMWRRNTIQVITTLTFAELPSGKGGGLQRHVSVSRNGRRARDGEVAATLADFGMAGAEEDNHHPGMARHFWQPLDPAERVDCECKATEQTVVEPDGYRWTNPTPESGEGCRGCEHQAQFGRPCPIHS